jgi:hypothetical protein
MTLAVFNDTTQTEHADKQKAELYMHLYQYAAEDFTAIPDQNRYADEMDKWGRSVEERLDAQGRELESHTHEITPHIHAIPPHVHQVAPHSHVSGAPGAPTSPEVIPLQFITTDLLQTEEILNKTNQTLPADNAQKLVWNVEIVPVKPLNSTGAQSNLTGNKIIQGTATIGDLTTIGNRRSLIIPTLLAPAIPPIMTGVAKAGI